MDLILIYSAFILAYFLRVGWIFSTDFLFKPFAMISIAAAILWLLFLLLTKYYRIPPRHGERIWYDLGLIFIGGAIAIAFLLVIFFFNTEKIFFSRLLNLYAFLIGSGFLMISQFIFRKLLIRRKQKEKEIYRTLIIGANRVAERIIHAIQTNAYAPYKIIGVIDPYGLAKNIKYSKILGKLNKLETVCEQEKITAIIQCDAFEHTINLISFCEEKDIKFQFEPALRGIFEENLRIREVAGMPMLSYVKRDYRGAKKLQYRIIDWALRQVFDVD